MDTDEGVKGSKETVKFGSDGQGNVNGQSPSEGTNSCPGSKGQGHIRSMEGKTGT